MPAPTSININPDYFSPGNGRYVIAGGKNWEENNPLCDVKQTG